MPNQVNYSESDLIELIKRDDERAMSLIFKEYYPFICGVIHRIVSDRQQAEDLAQDVFFELWKRRESLEISISLKAYLRRAGINKTLNYIRDRKIKWDDEDKLPFLASPAPDVVQKIEGDELQHYIDQVIDGLPERCRLVFKLSRFEEMTYQQIADEMGISIKTVENQMSKALRQLREGLDPVLKRR